MCFERTEKWHIEVISKKSTNFNPVKTLPPNLMKRQLDNCLWRKTLVASLCSLCPTRTETPLQKLLNTCFKNFPNITIHVVKHSMKCNWHHSLGPKFCQHIRPDALEHDKNVQTTVLKSTCRTASRGSTRESFQVQQ